MVNSSLAGVAGMGGRLRQLAILGLQHVSDSCLMAALEQLPLLQVDVLRSVQWLQGFWWCQTCPEMPPPLRFWQHSLC